MTATATQETAHTLEIAREELINAPMDVVFEAILEELGPLNQTPDGQPIPMKIEAWPGGRWYRDLGNNSGHLWGHVQSIKAPTLIEFYGPLFMSLPTTNNVQCRLSQEGNQTRLKFSHRSIGWIAPEMRDGVVITNGWGSIVGRIIAKAEQKGKK